MGSSPVRGIQPILSKEYVERKKDAQILICSIHLIATFGSCLYKKGSYIQYYNLLLFQTIQPHIILFRKI